jgi:hypothetical protein
VVAFGALVATAAGGIEVQAAPSRQCALVFTGEARSSSASFRLARVWDGREFVGGGNNVLNINGHFVDKTAALFMKHKRWPTADELLKSLKSLRVKTDAESRQPAPLINRILDGGLKVYFAQAGAAPTLQALIERAVVDRRDLFAPLEDKAERALMEHLRDSLRLPSVQTLAEDLKISTADFQRIFADRTELWKQAMKAHPELLVEARQKVVAAYLRAMGQRDRPEYQRTGIGTPPFDEILLALVKSSGARGIGVEWTLGTEATRKRLGQDLRVVLGLDKPIAGTTSREWPSYVMFPGGLREIEQEARLRNPTAFKAFRDTGVYGLDRAQQLLGLLREKPGFLVTSVNAGIPLQPGMLEALLAYADDLAYPIVVIPTAGIVDGLDERLLNDPRIFVLTHTIQNRFFKLWSLPILAKNQNSLASIGERGQSIPGQLVIVGHPQLSHAVVPTGSNHIQETSLWSPGSLSQNIYPSRHPSQGRTAGLAKNYHKNSFLVVEKADARSGTMGEGMQNTWHPRPVYFKDDRAQGGDVGFTDLGRHYRVRWDGAEARVDRGQQQPRVMVIGDLHDYYTDQRLAVMFKQTLLRFPQIRDFVIPDPRDGMSHNRHERERFTLLNRRFRSGELNIHREDMMLVQTINALLVLRPDLRILLQDSNHSYWLDNLIDNPTESQLVINGQYLAELRHGKMILGARDSLEYLLNMRNDYLDTLPPNVQMEVYKDALRVMDPTRVRILPFGNTHVYGPGHRPTHLNFHGHQGANGARGASLKQHAAANQSAILGDGHYSAILGDLFRVGTSTPKQNGYNNGGYSWWTQSFALVYPDGTKQLITYNSLAKAIENNPSHGQLAPEEFFGEDDLQLIPNDNELVPEVSIVDQHSLWLDMVYGSIKRDTKE